MSVLEGEHLNIYKYEKDKSEKIQVWKGKHLKGNLKKVNAEKGKRNNDNYDTKK